MQGQPHIRKTKMATTRIEHVVGVDGVTVPVTKLYSGSVRAKESGGN